MDAGKTIPETETITNQSIISLTQIIKDFLQKEIELIRVCRTAVLLIKSGVNYNNILFEKLAEKCLKVQKDDGGWSDVLETMWCVNFLHLSGEYEIPVKNAIKWISSQSQQTQGWGNSKRDNARITITGQILWLLPQISSNIYLKWMENEWKKEWKFNPCLTYKAAFTLMAFSKNNYHPEDREIIPKTVQWLVQQQNNDGGWGPWKNHPVGSDPWCTGISLVSILQYPDELPQNVLINGLEWIRKKQLPNGLWPYHYIEDGSSWSLYGFIMGNNFLYKKKND